MPKLFATDIKNYFGNAKREKKALIVFLDTYEKFVNEAVGTYEERARDLWLRGEGNSLMAIMPDTLWVIAGRSNLQWSGDYIKIPVQDEKISAFDEKFSKNFLKSSGVESENLREELAKLTQGSPIFLTLCVDIYEQFKERWGAEPDISEFGGEREKVAKRILKYMDDFSQDMLKFLCILNTWTDDIANEIGNEVLAFSETNYNQIKKFSFVQSETIKVNDFETTIYSFDKTVQSALFPQCSARMIKRTKKAAAGYFYGILDTLEIDNKYFFNFMYWTKFLSRLSVDDEELYTQYFNHTDARVQWLVVEDTRYEESENIVNVYFEKIKDAENKNTKPYAAFEYAMGLVKYHQEEFCQEAFNYAESAYKKFSLFPDKKLYLNLLLLQ